MSTSPELQTVTGYLEADHRRLDGLMEGCVKALGTGDVHGASELFGQFRHGLMRHIKIEEGLLFPEFEEATGMARTGGPTGVMRHEHAEIIRLLGLIQDLFAEPKLDRDGLERLRSALVALLHEHNVKEERILYPMSDSMIPPDRLAELVRRMKAF